jgi:hypothetical protein
MLPTPELAEAIAGLYRVFEKYPLRSDTDACDCRGCGHDEKRLHRKPLTELTREDLDTYAMDALYTWGTGDDFKHFIPRIFELLAGASRDCFALATPSLILAKLSYSAWCSTNWRSWPEDEQQAIENFLHTAWDAALESELYELPFDGAYGWLQGIATAELDLSSYLDRWLRVDSINSNRNLALMISQIHELALSGHAAQLAWRPPEGQRDQLDAWLHTSEVKQKLMRAFERWSEEPFANELENAAILLP